MLLEHTRQPGLSYAQLASLYGGGCVPRTAQRWIEEHELTGALSAKPPGRPKGNVLDDEGLTRKKRSLIHLNRDMPANKQLLTAFKAVQAVVGAPLVYAVDEAGINTGALGLVRALRPRRAP